MKKGTSTLNTENQLHHLTLTRKAVGFFQLELISGHTHRKLYDHATTSCRFLACGNLEIRNLNAFGVFIVLLCVPYGSDVLQPSCVLILCTMVLTNKSFALEK